MRKKLAILKKAYKELKEEKDHLEIAFTQY